MQSLPVQTLQERQNLDLEAVVLLLAAQQVGEVQQEAVAALRLVAALMLQLGARPVAVPLLEVVVLLLHLLVQSDLVATSASLWRHHPALQHCCKVQRVVLLQQNQ